VNLQIRELAGLLPDPADHELPEGRHLILRETLMQQIDEEPAEVLPTPVRKRRRRVLIPALAGGFMALIIAAWTTSAVVLGVGKFWSGSTEAGDLLGRIALVASSSTDIPPMDQIRDDQFVFVETYGGFSGWGFTLPDGTPTGGWSPILSVQRQIWTSVDGSQPGLLRIDGASSTSEDALDPDTGPLNTTLKSLATLPINPDLLLAKIYRETWGSGPNPQQEAFETIGDLIRESVVPPDVAVALYKAAARIPGIEVVDDAVDALGRHGIAVAREDAGLREEWIFDRETLQFRGERIVVTEGFEAPVPAGAAAGDSGTAPGTVIGSTAIVARAIVDRAGQIPG
jgi:hypothetical protein